VQDSGLIKDTILIDIPDDVGDFDTVLVRRATNKLKAATEAWAEYAKQQEDSQTVVSHCVQPKLQSVSRRICNDCYFRHGAQQSMCVASTTKTRRATPATRLTQNHKREIRGGNPFVVSKSAVSLQNVCSDCGSPIINANEKCRVCSIEESKQRLTKIATEGRVVSHSSSAQARRSETQIAKQAHIREWSTSDQPSWLTAEFYMETIQTLVADLSGSAIMRNLAVSRGYANEIRHGRVPHPRHWLTLATLLGLSK
jgi:hypothetical protein